MNWTELNPNIKHKEFNSTKEKERRILVIGDLHCPFDLEGYFDFCVEQYKKHDCNQVIFIGDLLDNHYSSFHPTDPNGLGGGDELEFAIQRLQRWNKEFPVADVIIGNHDRLIARRSFDSDIPKQWIKSYNEVLGTNWNWTERVVYDGVQFCHGEGGNARTKAKNDLQSTVQGHIHTQCFSEWFCGANFKVLAMQVGCGVNNKSYAAAYAKHFKKQAIACGVVIGGKTAINCMMDL